PCIPLTANGLRDQKCNCLAEGSRGVASQFHKRSDEISRKYRLVRNPQGQLTLRAARSNSTERGVLIHHYVPHRLISFFASAGRRALELHTRTRQWPGATTDGHIFRQSNRGECRTERDIDLVFYQRDLCANR